jgi:hypothetical protein
MEIDESHPRVRFDEPRDNVSSVISARVSDNNQLSIREGLPEDAVR